MANEKNPFQYKCIPIYQALINLDAPVYRKIAVALDFSENDSKLLASAIGQAKQDTRFFLIHIVESATAILHGKETADYETQKDTERLASYIHQLEKRGFKAEGKLGFRDRAKEIVKFVKESEADMLVVGTHGHTGVKDLIYGETVNSVRHELQIPILMVSLKNEKVS